MAYFFSVATIVPDRCAWFKAPFPRTTVSRCEDPPPVLLPIFVTVSQSSDMAALLDDLEIGVKGYEVAFLKDDSEEYC